MAAEDLDEFKTVEQGIGDYLTEKRGALDQKKESTKLTIQKIAGILKPVAPFLKARGLVYQEFVKMLFRCARELRRILDNPAELLLPVKTPKIEVQKKRLSRSRNCWRRSSACFPTSRKP